MRKSRILSACLVFGAVALLAGASASWAKQAPEEKTSASQVRHKVTEAADAIKEYSSDQRDEALKSASEALSLLDARIDQIEVKLREKWSQMDQAARDRTATALQELRRTRTDLAERYGSLKHSSREAWDEIKRGFLKSLGELNKAFNKAEEEFR